MEIGVAADADDLKYRPRMEIEAGSGGAIRRSCPWMEIGDAADADDLKYRPWMEIAVPPGLFTRTTTCI